jgi:hypothetical protein
MRHPDQPPFSSTEEGSRSLVVAAPALAKARRWSRHLAISWRG